MLTAIHDTGFDGLGGPSYVSFLQRWGRQSQGTKELVDMKVRLVISGRSYPTSDAIPRDIELPDGASVDHALKSLSECLPPDAALPSTCLIAVSGQHIGTLAAHQARALRDGDELAIIAPVAGG